LLFFLFVFLPSIFFIFVVPSPLSFNIFILMLCFFFLFYLSCSFFCSVFYPLYDSARIVYRVRPSYSCLSVSTQSPNRHAIPVVSIHKIAWGDSVQIIVWYIS
jgi:hypothetical protein